jgi:hypothetical protein
MGQAKIIVVYPDPSVQNYEQWANELVDQLNSRDRVITAPTRRFRVDTTSSGVSELDADTASAEDIANFLGTLVAVLKEKGFVS